MQTDMSSQAAATNSTMTPEEQEAPTIKTRSRPLFGLGMSPSTTTAKYPLVDRNGSPACGNVGQPGRPDRGSCE